MDGCASNSRSSFIIDQPSEQPSDSPLQVIDTISTLDYPNSISGHWDGHPKPGKRQLQPDHLGHQLASPLPVGD